VRVYTVKHGESPAAIAIKFAGCPKCTVDLVKANRHKPAVRYPNGFTTFRELRAGERLYLPDKWFSKEFDELPPVYFKALPHPDGVTPSTLGMLASGVLGDYAQLDSAMLSVTSLASRNDREFYAGVDRAAAEVDASVREAFGNPTSAPIAETVRRATDHARLRNLDFGIALDAGDSQTATVARLDVQNSLSTALGAARITLEVFYEAQTPTPVPTPTPAPAPTPKPPPEFTAAIRTSAQAAAAAIGADPNYCVSVTRSGTAVYSAVRAFKLEWNAVKKQPPLAVDTGYDQATADAVARVVGTAPTACAPHIATAGVSTPSTAKIIGWGLFSATAIGGALYYLMPTLRPR
jgi:hypothetical protein